MTGGLSRLLALALVGGGLAAGTPASAWTAPAHKFIATLAYEQLDPRAKAEVDRLIATAGASIATPTCKVRNVREAAIWSDCIRGGDGADPTSHTEKIPLCKPIVPVTWCKDEGCPSAQVAAAVQVLRDPHAPDAAKMRALADTLHLVGDVHQPMHAMQKIGGYQVIGLDGQLVGLHHLWDSDISRAARGLGGGDGNYVRQLAIQNKLRWSRGTMLDWAMESHQVAVDFVLPKLGVATCPIPTTPVRITQAYIDAAAPVAAKQIAEAGDRLAFLLNSTIG